MGSEPGPLISPSTECFEILSYLPAAKVFAASSKKTGHFQGTERIASPQLLTHKVSGYTSPHGWLTETSGLSPQKMDIRDSQCRMGWINEPAYFHSKQSKLLGKQVTHISLQALDIEQLGTIISNARGNNGGAPHHAKLLPEGQAREDWESLPHLRR